MAFLWSFWLLRWWQFWRLPETDASRRVTSHRHRVKVGWVRRLWLAGCVLVGLYPFPAFAVGSTLLLTFVSFVLLDETD